jgi:hypothetical protein
MFLVLVLIILGSFAIGMMAGIFIAGLARASALDFPEHHFTDPPASVRMCSRHAPYDWADREEMA